MIFILRRFPTSLCVFLTSPVAFVFYLFARVQGRAVRANLRALFPERSVPRCWLDAYQVFRQFALTYVDRLLYLHCSRQVVWDVQGMEICQQMKKEPGGVLVFTVHSGNYDIGSPILAEHLGRPLHTVRVPERSQPLDAFRTAELQAASTRQPLLRCHYNTPGSHIGIDLCRLLLAGEVVAVQGDRVIMDIAPLAVSYEGVSYTIPLGPLMLAETACVPCYAIFLIRLGVCRYQSVVSQPFYTGQRKMQRAELAALWIPLMADFLRQHWDQWFVFEQIIHRAPPVPTA